MKKILLLSDTHAFIDNTIEKYAAACDEIWHAGDIGSLAVLDSLKKIAPLRAVWGNIDDYKIRSITKETEIFEIENVKIVMTHIGGYPRRYAAGIKELLKAEKPKLFISGHSHILKVMFDKELNLMHFNPGAYGLYGFHNVRTMLRFKIDKENISDLEVIEIPRQ